MAKGKRGTTNVKNNKVREEETTFETSIYAKMAIVLCVLCFLGLFYLLAVYVTNKNSDKPKDDINVSRTADDYKNIMLGSSFNRKTKEYIVLYYDKSDSDLDGELSGSAMSYSVNHDKITIYTVDMSNMFNKSYITTEETNKNPQDVSELKINGTTLIRFVEGTVIEYIEGTDEVKNYLG